MGKPSVGGRTRSPQPSAARVFAQPEGISAAFLLVPALAVIGHAFHSEAEHRRARAIWGGIMGLPMALAPIIGGVIAYALGQFGHEPRFANVF